jgi:hypothetical protein
MKTSEMVNQPVARVLLGTVLILLVPLVAMQFTDEVNWSPSDFIVMAVLLLGTGLALEFVSRKIKTTTNRVAFSIVLVAVFLLVWAELAVGIFGSPLAGS